ncbi:unnamed protein product [Caenorhabditis auriculariae]|uniref:non-specific serine/threonine protein kinase n=1 Tax=Caenorhabditis auriculariae TaxID=2777116 RepID=A0A8S1GQR5_9PELO|nr:unnamed protein product [Caenorhabditis auriculariae]
MLQATWLKSNVHYEMQLANALDSCCSHGRLVWIEHATVKNLWQRIWQRFEDRSAPMDQSLIGHYISTIVSLLRSVDYSVFEVSPTFLVQKVAERMQTAAPQLSPPLWSNFVKHGYITLYELLTAKWGVESRSTIMQTVMPFARDMCSNLSVDSSNNTESQEVLWKLIDNLVKLCFPFDPELLREEGQQPSCVLDPESFQFVRTALSNAFKSLVMMCTHRNVFVLEQRYAKIISRWLLTLENFFLVSDKIDSETSVEVEFSYRLNEFASLKIGEKFHHDSQKNLAFGCALDVLENVARSKRLTEADFLQSFVSLWSVKSLVTSDLLRASFCKALSSFLSNSWFAGFSDPMLPSADDIFRFGISSSHAASSYVPSLNLLRIVLQTKMPSSNLPVSELVSEVLSRTPPSRPEALHLLSSFLAFCEFEEDGKFFSAGPPKAIPPGWRFRKEIISWILLRPFAFSAATLIEVCRYCPQPLPIKENNHEEDELLVIMNRYGLFRESSPKNFVSPGVQNRFPRTQLIEELVEYVAGSLKEKLIQEEDPNSFLSLWLMMKELCKASGMSENLLEEEWKTRLNEALTVIPEESFLDQIKYFTSNVPPVDLSVCSPKLKSVLHTLRACGESIVPRPFQESMDVVEHIANFAREESIDPKRFKEWPEFNECMQKLIVNSNDVYSMVENMERFGRMLSSDCLSKIRSALLKETRRNIKSECMNKSDYELLAKKSLMCVLREATPASLHDDRRISAHQATQYLESLKVDRYVVRRLLKSLKSAPLAAQKVVNYVMCNPSLWRIHSHTLDLVVANDDLYEVCTRTVPKFVSFLIFNAISLKKRTLKKIPSVGLTVNKFLKVYRTWSANKQNVMVDDFILMFGSQVKHWSKFSRRFMETLRKDPHFALGLLVSFAEEWFSAGLVERALWMLKAIFKSESAEKLLTNDLQNAFLLVYNKIFRSALKYCARFPTIDVKVILSLCCDEFLREDILRHDLPELQGESKEDVNFDQFLAEEVENFLARRELNPRVFGYASFYTSLKAELPISSPEEDFHVEDFLGDVWNLLPMMRPFVLPLLAANSTLPGAPYPYATHSKITPEFIQNRWQHVLPLLILRHEPDETMTTTCVFLFLFNCKDDLHLDDQKLFDQLTSFCDPNREHNGAYKLCQELADYRPSAHEFVLLTLALNMMEINDQLAFFIAPALCYFATEAGHHLEAIRSVLNYCENLKDKGSDEEKTCLTSCFDAIGLNKWAVDEVRDDQKSLDEICLLGETLLAAGHTWHASAVANLCFDKMVYSKRAIVMFERTSLTDTPSCERLSTLLKNIYLREKNADAMLTLPLSFQMEEVVQKVCWIKANEHLRVSKCAIATEYESSFARWMCGLPSTRTSENQIYYDSCLRGDFSKLYPKKLDHIYKMVYAILYHIEKGADEDELAAVGEWCRKDIEKELHTSVDIGQAVEKFRLLAVGRGQRAFLANSTRSLEEEILLLMSAVNEFSSVANQRQTKKNGYELNLTTQDVISTAKKLTALRGHSAALELLSRWEKVCERWGALDPNSDVYAASISACNIKIEIGDIVFAENKLLDIKRRFKELSETSRVELALALSKIACDCRNNLPLALAILEKNYQSLLPNTSAELRLRIKTTLHSISLKQLTKLEEYKESRSFRMKQEAIRAFSRQVSNSNDRSVKVTSMGVEESRKAVQRVTKEAQCERDDVEKTDTQLVQAATRCVRSALDALRILNVSDEADDRRSSPLVFQLIDVLFKYENHPRVLASFEDYVRNGMDSRFWLTAVSHLASRFFLGNVESSQILNVLSVALQRLVIDYPYHVVHVLLIYERQAANQFGGGDPVHQLLQESIDRCREEHGDFQKLSKVIQQIRNAQSAYREFVRFDLTSPTVEKRFVNNKAFFFFPRTLLMYSCDLKSVPIPVLSQPIGEPGDYTTTGMITWKSFKQYCIQADGLSAPKILDVEGSDGRWYKVVWKKDDVRQDFLVQNMFGVMDALLTGDSPASYLRTYNVLPLDTESGMIEFCGGTVSFKELLCGTNRASGIHAALRPEEPSAAVQSSKMKAAQKLTSDEKKQTFLEVCQEFSPVFRHFFYSHFTDVCTWRRRLNDYRESLAVWSIVCYVVGLGDRHASNILFDRTSASFIHIDLGMIFEYSKRTLPIPEQVPFRLTRDMIDPLLIEGAGSGPLVRIATEKMDLLKSNSKVILGLASALLRETMTNFREAEDVVGRPSYISEMAIGRLRDKLVGTDDGNMPQLSSVQVRRLFLEATNVENLSAMFCGWMAFL